MADKEYSTQFKIVQCYNGGIRVVTNALSLSILKLLLSKDMNLTEMASALGSPKTSVQINVSKLEQDGIVMSYPDEKDKRSTRYASACIPLFVSGKAKEWQMFDFSKIVENFSSDNARLYSDAMLFYARELNEYGICWHPFVMAFGDAVGTEVLKRCSKVEEALSIISRIYEVEFLEFKMNDNLSMRIRSDRYIGPELLYAGYAIYGTILYLAFKLNGYKYQREANVTVMNDHECVFSTELTCTINVDIEMAEPLQRDYQFYALKDRFAIYQPKGKNSVLIQNEIMLNTLQALRGSPKTVNEISTMMGVVPVTINASIKKMMELGFVEPMSGSGTRNIKYKIVAKKVLDGNAEFARYIPGKMTSYLEQFLDRKKCLFQSMFELHYFLVNSAGIRYESITSDVGKDVALEVVRQNPDMSPREFLDFAVKLYIGWGGSVTLTSIIPVTFDIHIQNGMVDFDLETSYFQTLVRTGLKELTGVEYPVKFNQVLIAPAQSGN